MSYNNYNQFSPYYQQPAPSSQSSAGHHYSNESKSTSSYSNSNFQPLSAYQSDYQRQQSQPNQSQSNNQSDSYGSHPYTNRSGAPATSAISSYSSQNYSGVGTSAAGEQQDSNSYASSRPDTSALGNLAYASSLGQDQQQPSLSQIIDYNRTRTNYGSSGYTANSTASVSQAPQASYAQGTTSLNQQTNQAQPYSPTYQAGNTKPTYSATGYTTNTTGRSSPANHQYINAQQTASQSQRQTQYNTQAARPASGQATQRPDSRTSVQSGRSPQVPASQMTQSTAQSNSGYNYAQSQTSNTAPHNYRSSSATNSPALPPSKSTPPSSSYSTSTQPAPQQANKAAKKQTENGRQQGSSQSQQKQADSSSTYSNAQPGQQATSRESQQPTTVDPNQVFNHYEYQRRQSEAEAARKALEATKAGKMTPVSNQSAATLSSPSDDVTQAAKALMGGSATANSDSATKEQIELEMKAMIEKMREYKAKDPTLFSQVWEGVKKGQPAASPSVAKPAGSKAAQSGSSATSPTQTDLPAESDLPAASSFQPGFDRGRYPMQRRRRGNAHYTPEKLPKKKMSKSDLKAQPRQAAEVDSASATPAPEIPDGNESMRKAMQQYRHTSGTPIPAPPAQAQPPAPKVAAPQPAKKSGTTGGTYWPEHKKRALAEAARMALVSSPPNLGKSITADDIHEMLDGNPSYHELCSQLERKGFVINKPEFARILLAAVPDMQSTSAAGTAQPQQPPPGPPPATSVEPAVPPPPPAYASPYNMWQPMPVPNAPVAQMHAAQFPSVAQGNQMFRNPQAFGRNGEVQGSPGIKWESGPSLPQSKQEKARKRDFGDIVDLTALSDEEDYRRRLPKPRIEKPKPAPANQIAAKAPASTLSNDAPKDRWRVNVPTQEQPYKPMAHKSGREHLLYDMVVDPMNTRRDARRRSSYDPKSIARDILVASGKHPTMAPLNQHLDGLRDRFISVDSNSDLSTFQWNLVDPGGVPPPKPEPMVKQVKSPQGQKFDGVDTALAKANAAIGQKQVNVPTGGQKTKKSGRPDFSAQPLANKNASGTPRPRGRPPNPNKIRPTKPAAPKDTPPQDVSRKPQATNQDSNSSVATPEMQSARHESAPSSSVRPPPTSDSGQQNVANHPPTMPAAPGGPVHTPVRVPGRKGRPPGAKNKQPRSDKGIPKRTSMTFSQSGNSSTTTPVVQPLTPATLDMANSLKRDTSTPVRPSGLRNAMTPANGGIAVVISSRSPSIAGSAQKGKSAVQEDSGTQPLSPSYQVYNCRWENCPAELHNLHTLRKHVHKQHRERTGQGPPFACKWADCWDNNSDARSRPADLADEAGDAKGQRERLIFADAEAWNWHVEERHLNVYKRQPVSELAENPDESREKGSSGHDDDAMEDQDTIDGSDLAKKKKGIGGAGIYATGSDIVTDKKREVLARGGGGAQQSE